MQCSVAQPPTASGGAELRGGWFGGKDEFLSDGVVSGRRTYRFKLWGTA
jgi:hypothetical protein